MMRFDPEQEKKGGEKKAGLLGDFPLSLLNLLETLRGREKKKRCR